MANILLLIVFLYNKKYRSYHPSKIWSFYGKIFIVHIIINGKLLIKTFLTL